MGFCQHSRMIVKNMLAGTQSISIKNNKNLFQFICNYTRLETFYEIFVAFHSNSCYICDECVSGSGQIDFSPSTTANKFWIILLLIMQFFHFSSELRLPSTHTGREYKLKLKIRFWKGNRMNQFQFVFKTFASYYWLWSSLKHDVFTVNICCLLWLLQVISINLKINHYFRTFPQRMPKSWCNFHSYHYVWITPTWLQYLNQV